MNTIEINVCMKAYNRYIGTFPRDLLPLLIPKYTGVIVNTDKSKNPGEHWVAIYNDDIPVYFDSYGNPPLHKEIIQFLDRLGPNGWCHNTVVFQGLLATTCGMYCIYFLKNYFKGASFDIFHVTFNKKQNQNDMLVQKLYKI